MIQSINILILIILGGSPFIYIPFLIRKNKQNQNRLIWIAITALLGLFQCMIYLMILVVLGVPL